MSKLREYLLNSGSIDELAKKYFVKSRRHSHHPNLIGFSYAIGCKFDQPFHSECRGIILDEANNWECIAFPFSKFWNLGEPQAAEIDWNTATVYEKLDGSMITLSKYNGEYIVATTGTPDARTPVGDFDYTFEQLFYEALKVNNLEIPNIPEGVTLIFELMTGFNQIVVPHPKMEVALLAARNARTGAWLDINAFPNYPKPKTFNFRNIDELVRSFSSFKGIDQEGYVVVDANNNRIKIKHPEYVILHRAATGTTFSALVSLALQGEVSETVAYFPHLTNSLNTLQYKIDIYCAEIDCLFKQLKELPTRKEFAMEATKTKYSKILFQMKDKNISAREVLLSERIPNVIDILNLRN